MAEKTREGYEVVRARVKATGAVVTVGAQLAATEGYEPLPGAPAVDRQGRPLPPEPAPEKGAEKKTTTTPAPTPAPEKGGAQK